jgi:hypothetical protein
MKVRPQLVVGQSIPSQGDLDFEDVMGQLADHA